MASFLDVCRFTPVSNGTGNFVVSSAVQGYQTPASAGAVNGAAYRYRAESADLTQWEVGYGTYTTSGTTLSRTTILCNSLGTTAAVNFTTALQVAVVALAEDLSTFIIRSYLAGLSLSAAGSTGTFGIAAGVATDGMQADIMSLTSAYTKGTGSWAVGSGNGALDTGTVANSTWYHVHLIKDIATGVVDVLFSLSATSPTMPGGYTLFRRIGSMKTDLSAHWLAFTQVEETFYWSAVVQDVNTTSLGTTAILYPLSVPSGVMVRPIFRMLAPSSQSNTILVTSPLETSVAAAAGYATAPGFDEVGATSQAFSSGGFIYTDTSSNIRVVSSATSQSLAIYTRGWIDSRGRFA